MAAVFHLPYQQACDLRAHYLKKHDEAGAPWRALVDCAAIVMGVAMAVLANMAGAGAFFIGVAAFLVCSGIGRAVLNRSACLNINREAAEALLTPGFFERATPKQLASAEGIVKAHRAFIA